METIEDTVAYFREHGFWASQEDASVEEIAARIRREAQDAFFGLPTAGDPLYDVEVLSFDTDRVWFIEDPLTLGARTDEPMYAAALGQLAAISRGRFAPTSIEVHGERYGWMTVEFSLGDRAHAVEFKGDGDVFCDSFLTAINSLPELDGWEYVSFHDDMGSMGFVLLLDDADIERFRAERGWKWHEDAKYYEDLAQRGCDMGQYAEAKAYAERGLAIDPDAWALLYNQGFAAQQLGEWEVAARAFRAALERSPEITFVEQNLESVLRELDNQEPQ